MDALAAVTARRSQDALVGTHFRTAAGLASMLTAALQNMLVEAEAYSALFEARIKHEENFIHALRHAIDKQNEVDGKAESKTSPAYTALFANGSATLRATWREMRENQTREIDMRQSLVENLRLRVVAPLQSFRESQERIRRRVKEDLKVSLAEYDHMREQTLPRLRKTYEKKCEQLEQLRGQQQAIDDQRTLLSQPVSSPQVPTLSTLRHAEGKPGISTAYYDGEELAPFGSAPGMSQSPSHHSAPDDRAYSSSASAYDHRSYSSGGSTYDNISGPAIVQTQSPPQQTRSAIALSTSPSSPPTGAADKNKISLREALRTKEGREAAIKDAPKKIQGFINRMRENAAEKAAGGRDRDASEGNATGAGGAVGGYSATGSLPGPGTPGLGVYPGGGAGRDFGATFESSTVGLVRGASAAKTIQNIALRTVQIKKESEDADRAYRKAVFDLETLRLRRSKTLAAAVTSVVECRRELNRTAQAAMLQAERAALSATHAAVSVHDRTEGIVEQSEAAMANEAAELESGLVAVAQDDEEPVPYINYWHGEARVIFGISLTDYAFSHQRGRAVQPPTIVTKCITYIERYGLEQQGIYRISARHSSIQALLAAVERDEEGIDFEVLKPELSAVAGLLKLYLRELPEPVMTMPWEDRIKYTHDREEHLRSGFALLKGRIRRLPPINNVTLKAIIFHLANVAAHSEKNFMTETNLAVIFGPVILTEADHETTSLAAAMETDRVVEDLIRHAPQIFDAGPTDPNAAGAPTTVTATMAHATSLIVNNSGGTNAPPSIAIPAVPLSSSLAKSSLASASSSSDTPLLPGAAGLKRSNAITLGETLSPPRREGMLHPHSRSASVDEGDAGPPTLPPAQPSPIASLVLDPMEDLSPEVMKWAEGGTSPAVPVAGTSAVAGSEGESAGQGAGLPSPEEQSLVSRSSTIKQAGVGGGSGGTGATAAGADVPPVPPVGVELSSALDPAQAVWDTVRQEPAALPTSPSSLPQPWTNRVRGASGDSVLSPADSLSSSSSIRRPLPQPGQPQPMLPPAAPLAAPVSDGTGPGPRMLAAESRQRSFRSSEDGSVGGDGSSTGSAQRYPPPVSELIFTRPPPTSPPLAGPPRPAIIKLNAPAPSEIGASTASTFPGSGPPGAVAAAAAAAAAAGSGPPLPPRPLPFLGPHSGAGPQGPGGDAGEGA